MSADYGLTPQPYTADPDPLAKSVQSRAYTQAGVDSGEIIIRGGTHYEFSFIPDPGFGGTLRGADEVAWYTTAWFDKYLKGDPSADGRLLTNRWRFDAQEAAIDPNHDGNTFSFYYRSRLNIGLAGGGRFSCEDIRSGCSGMASDDGWPGDYSYLQVATTPDPPSADLATTIADAPDPVGAGEPLTYTVTVTNNGFDTAHAVSLVDTLDRKVRFRSARTNDGSCSVRRTEVRCALSDLAEGDSATVTIVVRPTRKGTITNTATATALDPADPDATNNTATESTIVKP